MFSAASLLLRLAHAFYYNLNSLRFSKSQTKVVVCLKHVVIGLFQVRTSFLRCQKQHNISRPVWLGGLRANSQHERSIKQIHKHIIGAKQQHNKTNVSKKKKSPRAASFFLCRDVPCRACHRPVKEGIVEIRIMFVVVLLAESKADMI